MNVPRHAERLSALSRTNRQDKSARHAHVLRPHALRHHVLTGLLGVVVFLGSFVGLAYANIQGNIDRRDVEDLLGTDRPTRSSEGDDGEEDQPPSDPRDGDPINLVLIGSDERADDAADADSAEGMRSDVTMIMHISGDRQRVDIVSIPRDTLVDIPECYLPNGEQTAPRSQAMFNLPFSLGGRMGDVGAAAACTVRTIETWTGIRIDDFVVVDFDGFEAVVDALDGVPIYIEEDINDRRAQLELEAGCQVLDGPDALGYARARYEVPGSDGSDVHRIGQQQQLVAAIVREALSDRLLTDLPALYGFLDASTKTLTTSEWIGQLTNMAGLAYSLRNINAEDVRFATMPHALQGARVVETAETEIMWENLRDGRPIDADIDGTGEVPTTDGPTQEADDDGDDATAGPDSPPESPTPVEPEAEPTPECTR